MSAVAISLVSSPASHATERRHCPACRELVLCDRNGRCLWCDHDTEDPGTVRRGYCPSCDRIVTVAGDGSCWRCAGKIAPDVPVDTCACGCAATVRRFDHTGQRRRYAQGHNPCAPVRGDVNADPFVDYLRAAIAAVDPVEAVALRHGMSRDDVLALLNGDHATLPRADVVGALRRAAVIGSGKGARPRPNPTRFFDLYPDDRRSRTCPGCGQGKSPHAQLCKRCRTAAERRERQRVQQPSRLRADIVSDAYALHQQGLSVLQAARRLLDRTPYRSAQMLARNLHIAFAAQGLRAQPGIPVADELVQAAHRLHVRGGLSVHEIAHRLVDRSHHTSAGGLRDALYREFRARGLAVGRRTVTISAQTVRHAWQLHDADGLTIAQVADRLRLPEHTVRRALRDSGYRLHNGARAKRMAPEDVADAWRRYQAGESVRAVSEAIGVPAARLTRELRAAGHELYRGRGRPQRARSDIACASTAAPDATVPGTR